MVMGSADTAGSLVFGTFTCRRTAYAESADIGRMGPRAGRAGLSCRALCLTQRTSAEATSSAGR